MSRAKFEEWFYAHNMPNEHSNWFRRDKDGDYEFTFVQDAWDGWLAGRESMRDEAAAVCDLIDEKDVRFRYDYRRAVLDCCDQIRKIEP